MSVTTCGIESAPESLPNQDLLMCRRKDCSGWMDRIDEVLRIRKLKDDWDGMGAKAPTIELVDSALRFAKQLEREGYEPPSRIVAGVAGSLVFEWQSETDYQEFEITGPGIAECFRVVSNNPAEHWITWWS